jgi:DHA1 family bicyclomycin/chloramphenicol resistance-like MFS transporter
VFPCAMSGTVGPFPRLAGTAAGLFGFLTMAVASSVGAWIGASHNGTVMPLALTIGAASLIVLITVSFWVRRFPDRALPA